MATDLLDGEQVVALLWSCFNPTRADGRGRSGSVGELLGELDAPAERDAAIQAGLRLREAIAASSLDFGRDSHLAHVDRDAEQTIVVATTAGRTSMGWLHGAMLTRQPFCLCVYVHALERRRERQRLKLAYRRLFTINRGAESRGRVPDFDRYVQEHECARPERLGREARAHLGVLPTAPAGVAPSIRRSNSARVTRTLRPIRIALRYPWSIQFLTV